MPVPWTLWELYLRLSWRWIAQVEIFHPLLVGFPTDSLFVESDPRAFETSLASTNFDKSVQGIWTKGKHHPKKTTFFSKTYRTNILHNYEIMTMLQSK